jgi:two-component system response regulator NreC
MAHKEKIRLIIVDDNQTFLESVVSLIRKEEKYVILSCFTSCEELFKSNIINKANIILMDINMPGIDGFKAAQMIDYWYKNIFVVALTMYHDDIYLEKLIASGFKGFVNKNRICEDLFKVLDNVINNKIDFPKDIQI